MPTLSAISVANLMTLMYSALESPYGVLVHTDDPDYLRKKLITFRNDQRRKNNRSFDPLKFKSSPMEPTSELWIVHDITPEEPSDDTK